MQLNFCATRSTEVLSKSACGRKLLEVMKGVDKSLLQSLGSKSEQYISKRGWAWDSMQGVVKNSYTTPEAVSKATGNAATAFYTKAGDYVVVDSWYMLVNMVTLDAHFSLARYPLMHYHEEKGFMEKVVYFGYIGCSKG